jgi:hypothetical protein
MPHLPADFYAAALARLSADRAVLREAAPEPPPERWLQQLWRHQRIRRGELKALDGRPVRVLHPGFWNRTPGPDFQRAVIQLGDDAPQTGDVEIDVGVGGWRGHGHDRNARYTGVVLHVVWDSPPRELTPPVLALKPFLEAPLAELTPWLDEEAPGTLPPDVLGQCCAPLRELSAEVLAELLQQAARQRLGRKAGEFALRARHVGWEQALWEGLFAALGYRHNVWPMRRLAELVAPGQRPARSTENESVNWEARLLGLSGWLPAQLPRGENSGHIRSLWDAWWRERDAFADVLLPPAVWNLAGIRPANHPQRRLALAARWLEDGSLPGRITEWLTAPAADGALLPGLLALLCPPVAADAFWAHHWTLRSPQFAKAQPLLGEPRATDLAVNVILPWLHARAAAGRSAGVLKEVERRHFAWPAGEDNAVLKLIRARLFGGTARKLPRTAAAQQGLLQITGDFCDRANALCAGCHFPELVRSFPGKAGKS